MDWSWANSLRQQAGVATHRIGRVAGLVWLLLSVGMIQARAEVPRVSDSGVVMSWQVMAVSVSNASSANYGISLTGGETAIGIGSSENYGISGGFWTVSGETGCCQSRGDINHDGQEQPDIADLIYMVTYMFQEGPEPPCDEPRSPECPEHYFAETDVNGDGSCSPDIADLIYLVTYMFQEGPPLVPCP